MPEGLLIALKALLADGGSPRRWLARGTRPRDALARSSKGELPVEALPAPKLSRELTEAVAAWRAARETLRAALRRAGADDEALARLGVVPSAAMVGEVKDAATAVVQRAARALGLARAPEALTWLLAHDAALIEDPLSDEALLAPGRSCSTRTPRPSRTWGWSSTRRRVTRAVIERSAASGAGAGRVS